jgi:hypothetical protein
LETGAAFAGGRTRAFAGRWTVAFAGRRATFALRCGREVRTAARGTIAGRGAIDAGGV